MSFSKTSMAQAIFSVGSATVSTLGLVGQTNNIPLAILGGAAISGIVMSATHHLEVTKSIKSLVSLIALTSVIVATAASGYTGYTYMNAPNIAETAKENADIDNRFKTNMTQFRADMKIYKKNVKLEREKVSVYQDEETNNIKADIKSHEAMIDVLSKTFSELNKKFLDGKPSISTKKKMDKVTKEINDIKSAISSKRVELKDIRANSNIYKQKEIIKPDVVVKEPYQETKMNTEALFIPLFGDLVVILIGLYRRSYLLDRKKQGIIDQDNKNLAAEVQVYKQQQQQVDAQIEQVQQDNLEIIDRLKDEMVNDKELRDEMNAKVLDQANDLRGKQKRLQEILVELEALNNAKTVDQAHIDKLKATKKSLLGAKIKANNDRLKSESMVVELNKNHQESMTTLHADYENIGDLLDSYIESVKNNSLQSVQSGTKLSHNSTHDVLAVCHESNPSSANDINISLSGLRFDGDNVKAIDVADKNAMTTTSLAEMLKKHGVKSKRKPFHGSRVMCYSVNQITGIDYAEYPVKNKLKEVNAS